MISGEGVALCHVSQDNQETAQHAKCHVGGGCLPFQYWRGEVGCGGMLGTGSATEL